MISDCAIVIGAGPDELAGVLALGSTFFAVMAVKRALRAQHACSMAAIGALDTLRSLPQQHFQHPHLRHSSGRVRILAPALVRGQTHELATAELRACKMKVFSWLRRCGLDMALAEAARMAPAPSSARLAVAKARLWR